MVHQKHLIHFWSSLLKYHHSSSEYCNDSVYVITRLYKTTLNEWFWSIQSWSHYCHYFRLKLVPEGLLICCFTGIYPVTIYIYWLWEISDRCLELLQTNCTGYNASIPGSLHFDIACFLVIAERAGELGLQIASHFLLWWGLSFGLSPTHGRNRIKSLSK